MENWGKYSIENWAQMQPKLVVNPRMEKGERTALAIGRKIQPTFPNNNNCRQLTLELESEFGQCNQV